jgi:hypothetical protein
MMHTLLNGDTWYGKFGFVPKDNMKAKINWFSWKIFYGDYRIKYIQIVISYNNFI